MTDAEIAVLVNKLIAPVAHRVRMSLGRVVLVKANDATKMQSVQVNGLPGETLDNVEHFQNYGFTSVAFSEAEGLVLALGGERSVPVTICFDDRRYRLQGMQDGEVAMYDDQGNYIKLARGDKIIVNGAGEVDVTAVTKIVAAAPEVDINATTKAVVTAPEIDLTATTKVVVAAPEIDLQAANLLAITGTAVTIAGAVTVGGALTVAGAFAPNGGMAAGSGKLQLNGEVDIVPGPLKVNGVVVTVP